MESVAMDAPNTAWKPKPWIAVCLAVFLMPFAFLYLSRPGLAVTYFVVALVVAITGLTDVLQLVDGTSISAILQWGLVAVAALHAFQLAHRYEPIAVRPALSSPKVLASGVLGVGAAIFLVRAFLYEPFTVPSVAMYPTARQGSLLVVEKLGYGDYGTFGLTLWNTRATAELERGDLVVFRLPQDPSVRYFKRVIGLPGDTVTFDGKRISIDGRPVATTLVSTEGAQEIFEEAFEGVTYRVAHNTDQPSRGGTYVVPQDSYFVLGDNRDNSRDSRFFGPVSVDDLTGKVVYVL
jgi:signal peptidase I